MEEEGAEEEEEEEEIGHSEETAESECLEITIDVGLWRACVYVCACVCA